MKKMWNDRSITEFVRDVLGCGCPDEVFKKIEVHRNYDYELPFDVLRINIGDTLLIYLFRPASNEQLQGAVKSFVLTGRKDRDINGFNRFRLVIVGDDKGLEFDIAARKFAAETGEDEKLHIHFVKVEAVDGLQ
jgi:hypothetical protein